MSHDGVEITAELVSDLLRAQHPDLADPPVRLGARGWNNVGSSGEAEGVHDHREIGERARNRVPHR